MSTLAIGTPGVDTTVYLTRQTGQPDAYRREDSSGVLLETRPCTPEESARLTRHENEQGIRTKAQQALDANAAYLALTSPTNAQNLAQIRALTRECNALVRLVLGLLDDTTGT